MYTDKGWYEMFGEEELSHMAITPTEILCNIFAFISPTQLLKCREVCVRWKLIIDDLLAHDNVWLKYCKQDYNDLYKTAYYKCKHGMRWADIYRTLYLWPQIIHAKETRDEFASASSSLDEVRDFQILKDGIIGVHTRGAITYYDLETLRPFKQGNINGNYLRYMENESAILVLGYNLNLFVIRKYAPIPDLETTATFQSVKTFILRKHEIYFVTLNDVVYICKLDEEDIRSYELTAMNTGVMCIGYSNHLNILTFQRDIYSVVGRECKLQCSLGPTTNLLHVLRKFNLLDNLDWRVYFQWMYILNHSIPQGPLRDIIIIKTYGEAVFIGSNWGVFRIYYSPYVNGQFDIFNSKPIRQYNFMERCDCPVLSMCPIIQIDVVEGDDCHSILIAMPKKIAVITYTHNFYKVNHRPLSATDFSDEIILKKNK